MEAEKKAKPTIIVIFGATGDLTWRKLVPAMYNLYLDQWVDPHFAIIGVGRSEMSNEGFRSHLLDGINKFSRTGKAKPEVWEVFAQTIFYQKADYDQDSTYTSLKKQITALEDEWGGAVNRVFYMSLPPQHVQQIATKVGEAGLAPDDKLSRIVFEKPFGHDLESAKKLNQFLLTLFHECQIYRIDHYLGKETVQNIMAFRFANAMFEPLWNRNYIDHVQITVSEQLGVEDRGSYYDHAGALRDMIQNHLLQLLCLIAMEPPVSFDADEVRNRKVDVLHALRKISRDEVHHYAVRGQYGAGWIEGKKVPGYREEKGVLPDSNTDTFAAFKFFIDNWRWSNIPFYLRTGKRMSESISVITIQFKPVPHQSFPSQATENWQPNRLILNIQPQMGIRLRFQAKRPGLKMQLNPVDMLFNYKENYPSGSPEAYETLLLDVMLGDATLFMRADQVEAAWEVLMPILHKWEANPSISFPNYASGMQGPEESEALIARDGHNWIALPLEK
ncbi:glucose-6-phosphate dehydrogenase [Rhabdobacter roseus]|uniref:Glucose-6-phosphate 1-dehydrogenase n=1 Tax=Rhabdobacter roseus TaxID=1655419 RepID=A0A840TZ69_9BACT|nr:glucose-6-phosphate dehydrogenase [Rhabdobacter roseus]MBB5286912.1 glucose-6-phosphate 1-dehydrogenase [Rhabdobacter roseus]